MENSTFSRCGFDAAAIEVGVRGLTPYELRQAAASLAIAAGTSLKGVQRMLGTGLNTDTRSLPASVRRCSTRSETGSTSSENSRADWMRTDDLKSTA